MTDGAMQYRYRGYAPGRGMFDRRDPLGYAANQFGNLYAYARVNPVDFVDPMGLDTLRAICATPITGGLNEAYEFHQRVTSFLEGGYMQDPEVMAIINHIKSLRKGDPSNWRGEVSGLLNKLNSICDASASFGQIPPFAPWHSFRNLLNSCPSKEPQGECGGWTKDGWNPHHGSNSCYRGSGAYSGSQCCYGSNGALDDSSQNMGTYDYASPANGYFEHIMADWGIHLINRFGYAPGLTYVY
jgi:hypothetical protein